MCFVYILKSLKTGKFYAGSTINLDQRLLDHQSGKSKYIKTQLPLDLIHVEICTSEQNARKLEKYFKSGVGREIIKELF